MWARRPVLGGPLMPDPTPINPAKKRRFAREYLRDLNQRQAAMRAGFSTKNAGNAAQRLLRDAYVKDIIERAQAEYVVKYDITHEHLIRKLIDMGDEARAAKQYTAAIKATELVGRHVGMWPAKALEVHEGDSPITASPVVLRLEDMTPEERSRLKELVLRAKAKERAQTVPQESEDE